MLVGLFCVRNLFVNEVLNLIVVLFAGVLFYGGIVVDEEELMIEIVNSIKDRLISLF